MTKEFNLRDVINTEPDVKNTAIDDVSVIDKDWISSRFMTPSSDLEDIDANNRFYSTTKLKFTDSSLGGNIAINPRPQFTPYADIPGGNRSITDELTVASRSGKWGMGRYYSESLDDNAQTVFLEFGLPKFNSLIDFFTKAIDYTDSVIANTGRAPVAYKLGQFLGAGVMLAAFPLITLSIWAVKLTSKLILGHGSFNYYYLEPTMHMYWGAVNTIVTNLATEMGILIPEMMNDGSKANRIGVPVKISQQDLEEMKDLMPGIMSDANNYIDVFAIATRAQALANKQLLKERELYNAGDINEFDMDGYVKTKYTTSESKSPGAGVMAGVNKGLSFTNFLDNLTSAGGLFESEDKKPPVEKKVPSDNKYTHNPDGTAPVDDDPERESYLEKLAKATDSAIKDGGMHAVFYVDYSGPVSESFSNSTGQINTGDKVKSVAQKARNIKFDLAGGELGVISDVVSAGKDLLAGALDSVSFGLSSVISTMTGGGYVDIPKRWEDSDMSMPQITYNMQLISPYGNTISQLQNIYIPLAMLLAGTLPLSTGKSSYTSPFLCSLYSKGVQNIKLGMITSLSITRGTSNLGFNSKRKPLALDVSFTVTDFSTRVTAPVSSSLFDIFNVSLEDDTPLGNYIATLGSRDLLTSKYTMPKAKLRASRMLMKKDQMLSPASWGMRVGEGLSNILGGAVADHSLTLSHQN
jgi:hypothetical protein